MANRKSDRWEDPEFCALCDALVTPGVLFCSETCATIQRMADRRPDYDFDPEDQYV